MESAICKLPRILVSILCLLISLLLFANSVQSKLRHETAEQRQEHLLRTLQYYEIDYPAEVSHSGRHIRHVTTIHSRARRSTATYGQPVFYSVRFGGKMYRMKLHVNDKLFGSGFVVERHKVGGEIERSTEVENCYLIGEVQGSLHTAAISDCEGLSGVIDIGDDVIFIEPIINETSYRGHMEHSTRKPHLLYRKSTLHKAENINLDLSDDYWSAANEHAQGAHLNYRAAVSYIEIVNEAERPVKLLYLNGKKEMFFKLFGYNERQSINTYTGHRWLVRDSDTNKRLLIGGKKVYSPPANNETYRKQVYITVPKGLKLPKYQKPEPPDSFLRIVNRSHRFIQLYYIDHNRKRKLFGTMTPGQSLGLNSFTGHKWYVEDYDTGTRLWINTRPFFVSPTVPKSRRRTIVVTVPHNVFLARETFPDLLDIPPKYIEVMVAADPTVVKHHGKDHVKEYVLNLMNVVSHIFLHKSIGIKIYFVIVKVVLLEKEPKHVEITGRPMESLNRVCYWGHKYRRGWDKTSKEYYDQTVYLTKQNFGPSGYAPVSAMCYRTRSCTLNDDDGFTSAFIVAHETGHTLGMEHDGERNNCSKDVIKGSIMAPLVRSRFDRFYWSACSRRELRSFLDHLWCLDDVPFNLNSSLSKPLPGQMFDRDMQCVKDMGEKFKACKEYEYVGNPCRHLYCDDKSARDERSYCRSRQTSPLEGTNCGENKSRIGRARTSFVMPSRHPRTQTTPARHLEALVSVIGACARFDTEPLREITFYACPNVQNQPIGKDPQVAVTRTSPEWCRLGYCVPIRKDGTFQIPTSKPRPKPLHGNWTQWSKFGPCSHSCGNGVKIRARSCTNPRPKFGGFKCKGSSYEISICHNKPCVGVPSSFRGVRDHQCRRKKIGGHKDWSLYNIYKEDLNCDFEKDLCFWRNEENGKNDDFDWAHNTGKTPSGGTGPTFDHTKGEGGKGRYFFIETSRPTEVGWRARLISRHIAKHVTCFSFWYHAFGEDDHFGRLQLLLNTTNREKLIWEVTRSHGDKWIKKSVTILSLMPYRIVIQGVRGDGYRSDIAVDDFSFAEGACMSNKKPSPQENKIPTPPCLAFCESKSAKKMYMMRVQDGTPCYGNPAIYDVCVKGRCMPVGCDGKVGSKIAFDNCGICGGHNDTCKVSEGVITTTPDEEDEGEVILECPVGSTNILVEEFNESPNFLSLQINGVFNDTLINGHENGSTPGIYLVAGTKFMYSREAESEKLQALGPIKEPIVVKANKKKGHKKTPISIKYKLYKPNKEPTIYFWKPIGWSNCTHPCGGGKQKRLYDCYRKNDGKKVLYKLCYGVSRPKPWKQICNTDDCQVHYSWKIYQWSQCSVTCDTGIQIRVVTCIASLYGRADHRVPDANCTSKKPLTKKKCSLKECLATWKAGPWTLCSKTCGRGLRTRSVKCVDKKGKPSKLCSDESRLSSSSYCSLTKCVNQEPVVLGNLSCTFEAGFCKWRNSRVGDQFDWQLRSGTTPSRYTGPGYDHTFRSARRKGKYIYIEASAPRKENERARVQSPVIDISRICLDFWYHMSGDKMGTVNVYTTTEKGLSRLWFKKGNQGGRWKNKMIQISSFSAYRIIIEGVRGPGYASDMAIDDITVYSGLCPKSKYFRPECSGDTSRYCRLAVRYKWCSASAWGNRLCCRSCSSVAARYRQVRFT